MTATPELRPALDDAMEIVALTETRGRQLVAPVLTQILSLREHDVPEHTITALVEALRSCCTYNAELRARAHRVTRTLDNALAGDPDPLTVRSIVRTLRPALRVLRSPGDHDATEFLAATATVRDVAQRVPHDRLLSDSVRHNLGRAAHDLLVNTIGQRERVAA